MRREDELRDRQTILRRAERCLNHNYLIAGANRGTSFELTRLHGGSHSPAETNVHVVRLRSVSRFNAASYGQSH